MNIALVHDWVVTIGGSERCLEIFHELFPQAPLFTLVYNQRSVEQLGFDLRKVNGSFLQRFPQAQKWYRRYLPLYPLAVEQFDLSTYNVILSSSHAVAKGVLTRSDQLHVCYCHTPMRYAWDLTHTYLREHRLDRGLKGALARTFLHYIRMWDSLTANRVDYFIANSKYTAKRIWRTYRMESTVIYPPVNTDYFLQANNEKEDFFLFVSRLVPYKRADLVIETFNHLGYPLLVIGDGPQFKECQQIAKSNVKLLGSLDNNTVRELMAKARALVFAAEEDFGIVPVEAQACGTPVIAYGKGGVLETVIPVDGENWDNATGIFFSKQNVDELAAAIEQFLRFEDKFLNSTLKRNSLKFSKENFKNQIKSFVDKKWEKFN